MSSGEFKITEEMAQKIIDAPTRKIEESGMVSDDILLSEEERLKHVEKVMETWKKNR